MIFGNYQAENVGISRQVPGNPQGPNSLGKGTGADCKLSPALDSRGVRARHLPGSTCLEIHLPGRCEKLVLIAEEINQQRSKFSESIKLEYVERYTPEVLLTPLGLPRPVRPPGVLGF